MPASKPTLPPPPRTITHSYNRSDHLSFEPSTLHPRLINPNPRPRTQHWAPNPALGPRPRTLLGSSPPGRTTYQCRHTGAAVLHRTARLEKRTTRELRLKTNCRFLNHRLSNDIAMFIVLIFSTHIVGTVVEKRLHYFCICRT